MYLCCEKRQNLKCIPVRERDAQIVERFGDITTHFYMHGKE